jgi:hypothetical protein
MMMACLVLAMAIPSRPCPALLVSVWHPRCIVWALRKGISYCSGVDASVLRSGQDETLAGKEETLGESLVFGGLIALDNLGDDLELIRPQLYDRVSIHGVEREK